MELYFLSDYRKYNLDFCGLVWKYFIIYATHVFTNRNSSCGKVMLSQASVSHSVRGGGGGYPWSMSFPGGGVVGMCAGGGVCIHPNPETCVYPPPWTWDMYALGGVGMYQGWIGGG